MFENILEWQVTISGMVLLLVFGVMVFTTTALWVIGLRFETRKTEHKEEVDGLKDNLQQTQTRLENNLKTRPPSQAEALNKAQVTRKKIMNLSEFHLFTMLENLAKTQNHGYRLFAQVALGELLGTTVQNGNKNAANNAFHSFNAKRADFVFVDRSGYPALAIELNGSGHHQGNAIYRDAIKRTAFHKAGVPYVELPANYTAEEVTETVQKHLFPKRQLRAG